MIKIVKIQIEEFKDFLDKLSNTALIRTIRLSGKHYIIAYSPIGGR